MKPFKQLTLTLFCFLILPSCDLLMGDDADQPARPVFTEYWDHPEMIVNLENAKVFITYQEVTQFDESEPLLQADPRLIGMYVISDGEYTNATGQYGYNLADFNNATYAVVISTLSASTTMEVGEWMHSKYWWYGDSGQQKWNGGNMFVVMSEVGPETRLETHSYDYVAAVTGGWESGDLLSMKFHGGVDIQVPASHKYAPAYTGWAALDLKDAPIIDVTSISTGRSGNKRPAQLDKLLKLNNN